MFYDFRYFFVDDPCVVFVVLISVVGFVRNCYL
jgi:hypothetical protein